VAEHAPTFFAQICAAPARTGCVSRLVNRLKRLSGAYPSQGFIAHFCQLRNTKGCCRRISDVFAGKFGAGKASYCGTKIAYKSMTPKLRNP
jgi:hypothetical protein